MDKLELTLVIINVIFTFTLSSLFAFNLSFIAIKLILTLGNREKLKTEKA